MVDEASPRAYTVEEARDKFLKLVANYVDYWEKDNRQPTSREKLEGLAFSIMVILDGGAAAAPGFIVTPHPHESDKDWCIEHGENYYDPKTDIAGALHDNIYEYFKNSNASVG